ncbi:uncharacterized protein LOC114121082 [Aphis gossypii]|uniref:uncharacterized protein LOC114121082 n=1 Tax=Aphis gossypii TaxID=80765 RepID=UPI0021596C9F|nr:uncharacterized protein LOC114121082 [Aphis gossypii]
MKRWRNLRDTFRREHQKYVKSGSSMKKKAKYCYYDMLSFLQPNSIGRTTEGNIEHENENEIEDINVIDSPGSTEGQETVALPTNVTKVIPKHNKQKLSAFQENLLNAIEKNRIQTR